jgi:hypothetical protein
MRRALIGTRQRTAITAIVLASFAIFMAMVLWGAWLVIDNLDAPGAAATGSGPCGAADAVNIQLLVAEGQTVQACTRDRPACPNASVGRFGLSNQLRSSSRRYILTIQFDAALPAESNQLSLDLAGFPPEPASSALSRAILQLTPRDPTADGYTTKSGSLAVSSTHGVASGQFDGTFPPLPGWPLKIAGTFACNH